MGFAFMQSQKDGLHSRWLDGEAIVALIIWLWT
jgi:hypothetical protein